MTDRKSEAVRLRAQGLSYRAIGHALGASEMAVYGWLNPAYRNRTNVRRINHRIRQLEAENKQLAQRVQELERERTPFRSFSDAQAYWLATVSTEEFERIARGLSHAEYEAVKEAA